MDPLTLGVMWRAMVALTNDAGVVLRRTAYSEAVREGRDFSVGLFDRHGRMIVQGDFSPGHLGSMPSAVENFLRFYQADELRPGDCLVLNDPWMGSGHLPDFFMLTPCFVDDMIVGYAVNCTHMIDVGGAAPGSQQVEDINDQFQEGLRLWPTRVWSAGEPNHEVLRIIEANVRIPDKLLGDLMAMRNCNRIVEQRLAQLIGKYGMARYDEACDEVLDRSEAATRAALATMPDGTYRAVDHFDDYGPGTDPLRIEVAVTVDGDSVTIDFTGSSPQTASGINAVLTYVRAFCYYTVKCVTSGGSVPQNGGCLRPITFVAEPGSVVNAQPPVGVGARAIMQQRFVDVLMQAFAEVMPERVIAPSSHWANPNLGGHDPRTGRPFVHYDIVIGGFGGRAHSDGMEATPSAFNIDGIPVEVNENAYPVRVERLELIPDSAGAGRNRGGHGIRKDVTMLGENMTFSNLTDRQRFAPPGILGGQPGEVGRTVLHSADGSAEPVVLGSKGTYQLRHGDRVSTWLSGGGGYGDPLDREPERVAADVAAGLLSVEKAARAYGVVVNDAGVVDVEATRAAREELDIERRGARR
ncbi:hydantoinase B/oxoprolinase family protein [Pseudonocardia acaciae]|uniref:hydantoinase B/oxoprolinase family protein n=1 Tax=Pseudonocardia acaciae TaxID=551276 RepID=UPI000688E994|nr:hydantoinase B/oxoprolinase family protein [Pseudonocardia acaciae]